MIRRLLLPALLALVPSVFGPGALAEVADADPGDLAPQMADVFGRMGLYTLADMTRRCAIDGSFDPDAPALGAVAVDLHALDQLLAHRQVRHVDFVEALAMSLHVEGLDALAARVNVDLMPTDAFPGLNWTINDDGHLTWAQATERFQRAESAPAEANADDQPRATVSAAAEPSAAERVDRLFAETFDDAAYPKEFGQAVLELAHIAKTMGAPGIARLAAELAALADPNIVHDTGDASPAHLGRYPVTAYAERWATLVQLPPIASNQPPLTPDHADLALSQTQRLDVGRVIAVLERNTAAPGLQRFAQSIADLSRAVDAFHPRQTDPRRA